MLKSTRAHNWKYSEKLTQFNNKQLICYIEFNKMKKGMSEKTINEYFILDMTRMDEIRNIGDVI